MALFALLVVAPAATIGLIGVPYYLTGEALRPDHWLHPWYRPGSGLGLMTGLVGTVLLTAMLLYSLRKWFGHSLLGDTSWWLRFHIVCGVLGPAYIVLHSGFVMPSGFVAIGFWCMIITTLSGMFGVWVFPLLPSAAQRAWAALDDEDKVLSALRTHLRESDRADGGRVRDAIALVQTLESRSVSPLQLMTVDMELARRQALVTHHIESAGLDGKRRAEAKRVLNGQLRKRRRAALLEVAQRVLAPWTMLHWPLSLAMYVVAFFHIVSALIFGNVLGGLTG